jgi:predicted membrane channel-forming protein YqfA (hemolysin III family)
MGKGLMIMLVVFLIIAMIGWVLNVFSKVSEEKKEKYRNYLFVLIGAVTSGKQELKF